jgi:hypothetical protein
MPCPIFPSAHNIWEIQHSVIDEEFRGTSFAVATGMHDSNVVIRQCGFKIGSATLTDK